MSLIWLFFLAPITHFFISALVKSKWTCIYITLPQSTDHSKRFTAFATFTHSHTHSYTGGRGCHVMCQLHIKSNSGLSILLKDTSTCHSVQPGGAALPPDLQLPCIKELGRKSRILKKSYWGQSLFISHIWVSMFHFFASAGSKWQFANMNKHEQIPAVIIIPKWITTCLN